MPSTNSTPVLFFNNSFVVISGSSTILLPSQQLKGILSLGYEQEVSVALHLTQELGRKPQKYKTEEHISKDSVLYLVLGMWPKTCSSWLQLIQQGSCNV